VLEAPLLVLGRLYPGSELGEGFPSRQPLRLLLGLGVKEEGAASARCRSSSVLDATPPDKGRQGGNCFAAGEVGALEKPRSKPERHTLVFGVGCGRGELG